MAGADNVREEEEPHDYWMMFTDTFSKDYLNSIHNQFANAKDEKRRQSLMLEAQTAMRAYAVLVYCVYPLEPEFRKKIDSDRELSGNFDRMHQMLEQYGGSKIAKEYFEVLGVTGVVPGEN